MLRNMVTSLFEHGRIETTLAKAKELRPIAEKMITKGKRGDLHARRQTLQVIRSKAVVKTLFEVISPVYRDRNGGYTRIMQLDRRQGDGAPMCIIELVDNPIKPKAAEKPKPKAKEKTPSE
jgi:large subunit ribosomal protein L17